MRAYKSFFLLSILIVVFGVSAVAQKKEIGVQLFSVRDIIGHDAKSEKFQGVLQYLAKLGYTTIEAAGYHNGKFYNTDPAEFKQITEKFGFRLLSSHVGKDLTNEELASGDFSGSLKWWDQAIAAHKAAGIKYMATPWLSMPKTVADLHTYCLYFNEIGKKCKEQGISYGYHNHDHEFRKIENKVVMLDYMIENTDPEYVFFELDVYWAVMGRTSPVDYFNKYKGRFPLLHIKDRREIGKSGMVGFDAIFNQAHVAGVKHYFVEVESYSNSVEESMKESIEYLKNASFVKKKYTD